MSARKRPLELGSDDQSDFGNKRQKMTHNGANNTNGKEITLDLNNDIQKKIEENRLAALRRKEEKLAREKNDSSPSQSSQVKPQQLQKLQQHLRSPARGSSQQSQGSPSTSPSATSPVKDYAPIPMNRPELTWAPKTPPDEKPSSAMKNSKITNYFVFEKDPPVKSPHFSNADVPPRPQDLGNVARKINFDAKTSPAKTPAIMLSKHDSNLSNGKYDVNTQTDESQNMEEDNAFDLSLLCEPSQPPTQPLPSSTPKSTQSTTKVASQTQTQIQTQTPTRAAPPSAAPKKASPAAPKKTPTPAKPTLPTVSSEAARKDASLLQKFYHNESVDTQTDDSMLTESTSLRGSNGFNNNNMTSSSREEEDLQKKTKSKNKLQSLSYSKSNDDEEPDEDEAPNLKKSALLKEDEEQKGDWWRNPRDKTGKRVGDAEYDPSTLYIPADEFNKLTEAKKQYWTIKKDRFDEIIFFQQGDFYNLFGPDADIGCEQLGLLYNAKLMSVGVNRRDYREWARKFAALGYKVTRVDQESTATTEQQKNQKQTKKKKTEERKVTEFLTAGTMRDLDLFSDHNPSYLLILKEGDNPLKPQFGVCFVDTSTNEFGLCSFEDDERCSHFETILLQLKPKEILHDKGVLSPRVRKLVTLIVGKVTMTARVFPSAQQTEDLINYGNYFAQNVTGDSSENWPEAIKQVRNDELLMRSLGAAVSYFEELNFAKEIVPVANYFHYDPNNQTKYLILDYVSLSNLEILQNNDTGATEGSLLHTLNHCATAFGKRMLRKWLCHPLRDVNTLNDRFDCVEYFMEQADFRENLRVKLRGLNDIERYMTRVQACTVDLATFLTFIDNMSIVQSIMAEAQEIMTENPTNASLLNTLVMNFPNLDPFFELYSFDRVIAKNQNKITPKPNTMPDYDEAVERVNQITTELDNFLKTQKKNLGIASLEYHFSKSENYTIKVKPQFLANKKVPKDWTEAAKLKSETRFEVPAVVELHAQLVQAKEELDAICTRLLLEYLHKFEQVQTICKQAIEHLAQLDILMSFAVYAWQSESSMCRPKFVMDSTTNGSYVEFKNMRHPYLKPPSGIFVPNDIKLGGDAPKVLLITGPNMGGKSTVLRQVAILTVMAQIGCFVPAETAVLTPVDRIFTRIGARDNIMGGLSTFMVELEETAKMLKYATGRSVVILDELGRGTSTFDGYSIAYAVLKYLETLDCRVLFSTHYHKLTDEFTDGPNANAGSHRHLLSKSIASSHMACKEEDGHMTFLYKLQPGACPKSYGMHVASMANIQQNVRTYTERQAPARVMSNIISQIIQRADEMSAKFEEIVASRRKKQHQKKQETFLQLLQATPNAASNHQLILSLWRDCKKIVV